MTVIILSIIPMIDKYNYSDADNNNDTYYLLNFNSEKSYELHVSSSYGKCLYIYNVYTCMKFDNSHKSQNCEL